MSTYLNIESLLQRDEEARDEEWEKAFLHVFPTTKLRVLNDTPQPGPDGFPYLMVEVDEDNGTEPAAKVIHWLADKGIGLVVNSHRNPPDYVFTYGQLWNFKERGVFNSLVDYQPDEEISLQKGQEIHVGAPSEDYLPPYVREILRAFFLNVDKEEVKVLMVSEDGEHYDMCLSLESLGSPKDDEHMGILEAISWFLPTHYSLVLISENGLPEFHRV